MPHRLAGAGKPGSALEVTGEMLPHEQWFLAWLNTSESLAKDRGELARTIGLRDTGGAGERRMVEMYRKFRDVWGILERYHEGFGEDGRPVDRFVRSPKRETEDLAFLKSRGVASLMTLTERPIAPGALEAAGLSAVHIPIVDKDAPGPDQVDAANAYLDRELGADRPVAVHCLGGFGRTGTILASYLVHCGATAEEAMAEVRRTRAGSIETEVQEEAVRETERRIR